MVHVGEYLDFKPSKEGWNLYKLEQDVLLKMKLVMIKIHLEAIDESGNPAYESAYQIVMGIIPPSNLRGKPSDRMYSPKEMQDAITQDEVKVTEIIREDWNEYELSDTSKLSIKLILTKVSKTSLFDREGEPIYNIQHQVIIKGNVSSDLRVIYQKRYQQMLTGKPQ